MVPKWCRTEDPLTRLTSAMARSEIARGPPTASRWLTEATSAPVRVAVSINLGIIGVHRDLAGPGGRPPQASGSTPSIPLVERSIKRTG